MNEITQSFALVAVLGNDVPDSFACFQRYVYDTDCFGRTGATSINIADNDGMFSGIYFKKESVVKLQLKYPNNLHLCL